MLKVVYMFKQAAINFFNCYSLLCILYANIINYQFLKSQVICEQNRCQEEL